MPSPKTDCVVIGASFAGLAAAYALARSGLNVTVLEKKRDVGEKLHTTGIIVKDAIDQIALLDAMPAELVRRIPGVRLYAPNLTYVDLDAPGYYFLATDTPGVMRWLAGKVTAAGAHIAVGSAFRVAVRVQGGFDLGEHGNTRYLIGADGPRSHVARALGLGTNKSYLVGVEYEYANRQIDHADRLHCFIDRRIAPGYIGWVLEGVSGVQAGLARRQTAATWSPSQAMSDFTDKIASAIDLRGVTPTGVRAGLVPCGGVVSPVAASRTLLVGDAAGMVSPVTAGGIHTALKHGLAAGNAVAGFLRGNSDDPSVRFVRTYPSFRLKRALRFIFDHFQSDAAFNLLLATQAMRSAAGVIYFHHKGLFDPSSRDPSSAPSKPNRSKMSR